jgi:hypothetical protein
MSALELLRGLFRYQGWANDELLEAMEGTDPERHNEERQVAMRLINHCHVVNQIFLAHLVGKKHTFSASNTPDTRSWGIFGGPWRPWTAGISSIWDRRPRTCCANPCRSCSPMATKGA